MLRFLSEKSRPGVLRLLLLQQGILVTLIAKKKPNRPGHGDSCGTSLSGRPRRNGSDEEAEAKPTESGVAGPVDFMQLHSSIIDFVFSLNKTGLWGPFCFVDFSSIRPFSEK